jgi:Ankyrin repeats (many copies)
MPLDLGYGSGAAVARGGGPFPIMPVSRSEPVGVVATVEHSTELPPLPKLEVDVAKEKVDVVAPSQRYIDFPPLYRLRKGKGKKDYSQQATGKFAKIVKEGGSGNVDFDTWAGLKRRYNLGDVKQLLEEGADPNVVLKNHGSKASSAMSLLFGSGGRRSEEIIAIFKLLLDHGARIHYPLVYWLEEQMEGPKLLVLERGIRVSDRLRGHENNAQKQEIINDLIYNLVAEYPLISAIIHEDLDELRSLLNQDQSVLDIINEQDDCGRTALHWAMALGNSKAMMLLLRAGADDTIKNEDGLTPLGMALRNGNMMMQWVAGYEEMLDECNKQSKWNPKIESARDALDVYRGATERYQDMLDTYYMYKNRRYIPTIYNLLRQFASYTQRMRIGSEAENKIVEEVLSPAMYRAFLRYRSSVEASKVVKTKIS